MASKVNLQDALKIFTNDGKSTLDAQQASNFASLFTPTSEDEVLAQFGNSDFDEEKLRNLVDHLSQNSPKQDELLSMLNRINSNKGEVMSKNTLYHIFKNSNRVTMDQFDQFLTHLGMNNDQINLRQFVEKLTHLYQQ